MRGVVQALAFCQDRMSTLHARLLFFLLQQALRAWSHVLSQAHCKMLTFRQDCRTTLASLLFLPCFNA